MRDDLRINGFSQTMIDEFISDKNHISLKHWYGDYKKIKPCGLGRAIELENFTFEGVAHRGIDDAKNITKIFNRYRQVI